MRVKILAQETNNKQGSPAHCATATRNV